MFFERLFWLMLMLWLEALLATGCRTPDWHGEIAGATRDGRQRVEEFVYLQFDIEDRLHFLDDPHTKRCHQPPRLIYIAHVRPGQNRFVFPGALREVATLLPIPMHSIPSGLAWAYAKGFEVARHPTGRFSDDEKRRFGLSGREIYAFRFWPVDNVILPYPREEIEGGRMLLPDDAALRDPTGKGLIDLNGELQSVPNIELERILRDSAREIAIDLENDNLWREIRRWWDRGREREAIRYVCEYYLERYDAIRRANPQWKASTKIEQHLSWLRSVAATPVPPTTRPNR
ncbi:MAG: hypothetical protein U1A27_05860 [Phycisphaerae bacterium]